MPTSWIGRAFKAATDQVPKVAAVTGSSLLASPGGPVAMAATGTAVGSMVYGSTVGLEAYRTNSSRAGALTYGHPKTPHRSSRLPFAEKKHKPPGTQPRRAGAGAAGAGDNGTHPALAGRTLRMNTPDWRLPRL